MELRGLSSPGQASVRQNPVLAEVGDHPVAWLLMMLWAAGTLTLLGSLARSMTAVARLERRSRPFPGGHLEALTARLATRMAVKGRIRLLKGTPDSMPMSWGIVRPVILLPDGAHRWQQPRIVSVLLHELAHVRRRDCLTQFVAEVALAFHWFNPLAWLAARRLRVEREHACDDLVLAAGTRASDYATELLSLAQDFRSFRGSALAAVAMARPVHLGPRLKALFDERRRRTLGPRGSAAGALAATACLLGLAAFTPVAGHGDGGPEGPASDPVNHGLDNNGPPRSTLHALAETVPLAGPFRRQEASCGLATDGWRHTSSQSNNERHHLTWSRPGCEVDIRLEGDLEFTPDFREVERLGRDALLRIEEEDGGTQRRLDVRPGPDGRATYQYRVDGTEQQFDGDVRAWYQAMLLQAFRRGGFMAEERVAALLRSGGVGAVLGELDQLSSDHVFAAYGAALLDQADLTEAQAVNLVERAGRQLDSDHYLSSVLEAVATNLTSPAITDAFIGASRTLESDHYRAEVLGRALTGQDLSPVQVETLLQSASEIESDHYLAELLTAVGTRYVLDPELQDTYLQAVESIESDHYRTEVLSALLSKTELDDEELLVVLRAAGGIESDHYLSSVLEEVASTDSRSEQVRQAAIRLTPRLESDHYRAEVLRQFLSTPDISQEDLRAIIGSAAEIGSDHYKAEVLSEIAEGHRLEGEIREAFMEAMDTIGSSHYRGEVAEILLRQGQGGR